MNRVLSANRAQLTRVPSKPSGARRRTVLRVENYRAPSYAPGATALESLSRHSYVLSDRFYTEHEKIQAGAVSCEVLSSTLLNPTAPGALKACVRNAFAFKSCAPDYQDMGAFSCQIDKALCNVAAHMLPNVEGKIAIEVDPRLAGETKKMIKRVELLAGQLKDNEVPLNRVLFRIPATFQGIEAAQSLEKKGFNCLMVNVFSFAQARKAAEAGASVIKLNLGALQDFQREFPNVIRDPSGPREDSGFKSPVDPGLKMVEEVYNMVKSSHPKTQVMVADIRSAEDALSLAGVDYLMLNNKVLTALSAQATDEGYNDGLSAATTGEGVTRKLSPATARDGYSQDTRHHKMMLSTEREFAESMGIMGRNLTSKYLTTQARFVEGLAGPLASTLVQGTE